MKKILLCIGMASLLLCSGGCGSFSKKDSEWKTVKPQNRYFTHTVRWPGENLKMIAAWYTGSSSNWQSLAKANPVVDPDRPAVGNTILIPDDLLRQKKPLPQYYLTTFGKTETKDKKQPDSKSGNSTETTEEIILFGPK